MAGSVASGCKTLYPSGDFFAIDKCAIIEVFNSPVETEPPKSYIVGTFPLYTLGYLGVTGVLAISISKDVTS